MRGMPGMSCKTDDNDATNGKIIETVKAFPCMHVFYWYVSGMKLFKTLDG
jgi:hypothetical protein